MGSRLLASVLIKTKLKMATTTTMTAAKNLKAMKVIARLLSTSAQRSSGGGGPGVGRITAPHGDSGWKKWRNAFVFIGIPCIILGHVNAFGLSDPEEHARPEFIAYDHMRTRNKRFPWGDGNHSLIHNPQKNALPDGYEEEEEHHH